jgi:hypothetical protein
MLERWRNIDCDPLGISEESFDASPPGNPSSLAPWISPAPQRKDLTVPVHLQQSAKDLQEIAKSIVANPTVFKQVRRSGFAAPVRRAVQSKRAFGSAAAGAGKKLVSTAIGFIPLPALPSIIDGAWNKFADFLKQKQLNSHLEAPANLEEKVKFELKTIGDEVAHWDAYRWKVHHALEQFNKAGAEAVQSMERAPCDTWVRVWAKYYYLGSRMQKLRASVAAVRAVTEEVDVWLLSVEQAYEKTYNEVKAQYDKDVPQLKQMQVHDTCSDVKCMFKKGSYTKQMTVPTSDPAKFFIKATSTVAGSFTDKMSTAVDKAAAAI